MIVRPATPADVAAIGRVGAALMHVHYAFDPLRFLTPHPTAAEGYASFRTAFQNAPAQALCKRLGFRETMIEMTLEL